MNSNFTLVSVVVTTYNSSSFILETLDSIYRQTYKNIELIISDDFSTDNTLDLCKEWVKKHENRFIRSIIITSNTNTGVAANCNRGYKAAEGEWIKDIAGDDILLPNCIESYINYIETNKDVNICVAKAQCFHVLSNGKQVYGNIIPTQENQEIYKKSPIDQLKILVKGNIIVTPTLFVKKEISTRYPYNELYRYMEDIPFFIDVTKNNIKIHFLNEVTVLYRFSSQSLSQTKSHFFPSKMFESKIIYFFNEKKNIMNSYSPETIKTEQRTLLLWLIAECFLNNDRSSLINRIIFKLLRLITK